MTLLVGKQLEPLWGSKEMLRFILVVTLSTSCATFFTCIFLYASSQVRFFSLSLSFPLTFPLIFSLPPHFPHFLGTRTSRSSTTQSTATAG